jgi:hypothetical protein
MVVVNEKPPAYRELTSVPSDPALSGCRRHVVSLTG